MERSDETDDSDALRDELRDAVIPGVMQRRMSQSVKARLGFRPAAPTKVGRNTIIGEIGSGGMGTVYAAFDEKLDRKVAVKVLRGEREWHPRVLREGQALAKVSHPNVVQVYEAGEHDGDLFLSMEFVDGPTLAEWLKDETRSWRDVLGAFVQAGRGLAAAHAAGIIHRDFKPQNVLVGTDGRVRVLDFGLARSSETIRSVRTAPPDASGVLLQPITRSGAVLGTRLYMSPEQHRGEEVDERADQFSFCVALYEALYKVRPFEGDTERALMTSVLDGKLKAPPSDSRVPAWVRRVVMKGLATRPGNRHPSMDAVLELLGRDPALYVKRAAIGLGVVVALGALAMLWQRREDRFSTEQALLQQEKEVEHAQRLAEQEQKERLTREARRRRDALTLAEVGRFELDRDPTTALARLKNLSPKFEAWTTAARMLASDAVYRGVATRVLTLPEGEVSHGLSPDGRVVVTRNPKSSVVKLLDIESGTTRELGTGGTMPEVAFSPDGRMLAALRLPRGLRVWDLDGDTDRVLGDASGAHVELAFDSTGGIVVYGRDPELHRWQSGSLDRLGSHTERVTHAAVGPSGKLAATVDAGGHTRLWDLDTLEFEELAGPGPVAFALDGRVAWVTHDGAIAVSGPTADQRGSAALLSGTDAPIEALTFSPGGTRLAAATIEGEVVWWRAPSPERSGAPHVLPAAGHVASLRWVGDDVLAATTLEDLVLHPLDGGQPQVLQGHEGVGFWAAKEGGRVVTVGHEGSIRLWRRRASPMRQLRAHEGDPSLISAGPRGTWHTADDRGVILRWDEQLETSQVLTRDPSSAPIVALASNSAGAVAWANDLGDVLIATPDAQTPSLLTRRDEGVLHLAWAHDAWLVTTETALVRADGRAVRSVDDGLEGLSVHWAAAATPGHRGWRAIASTEEERYFVVTSAAEGPPSRSELPTEGVMAAAFASDGSFVAFSGFDRSVAVWDASSGEVRELGRHAGLVRAVDVSPDATTLITAGDDGVVKLWDVSTGKVRTVPLGRRSFEAVAMSDSGDQFVALTSRPEGSVAFVGRDDLPRTPVELRRWVSTATDLAVETQPIDWVVR